jgi:hypothetical protein
MWNALEACFLLAAQSVDGYNCGVLHRFNVRVSHVSGNVTDYSLVRGVPFMVASATMTRMHCREASSLVQMTGAGRNLVEIARDGGSAAGEREF